MLPDIERRTARDLALEGRQIRGYAIVFNELSEDLGGFREIIAPEAVDRRLREALDVRALVDHDTSKVLGRTAAGTLRLAKDSRGLRFEIDRRTRLSAATWSPLCSVVTCLACRSRFASCGHMANGSRRETVSRCASLPIWRSRRCQL
jgi:hypothetical protein